MQGGAVPPSGARHAPSRSRYIDGLEVNSKDSYEVGKIIFAPLHEQDNNPNTDPTDPALTVSNFGNIYTKPRHFIVVARYHHHYIALPMFTHGGNGLSRKPNKDEYISIQDHRDPHPVPQQSPYKPLKSRYFKGEVRTLKGLSTIFITFPVSRDYNAKCTIEGKLDEDSIERLQKLYKAFCLKGTVTR